MHLQFKSTSQLNIQNQSRHILITRPIEVASEFESYLQEHQFEMSVFASIDVQPLTDYQQVDRILQSDRVYDYLILTSSNGAKYLQHRAQALSISLPERFKSTQIAVVGPQTASVLQQLGLAVDIIPAQHHSQALAHALSQFDLKNKRILSLRSQIARPELIDDLASAGALIDDLPIYMTLKAKPTDLSQLRQSLSEGGFAAIAFASASSARYFASYFEPQDLASYLPKTLIASIGPMTSQACLESFGRVDIEANPHTMMGLAQSLVQRLVL